MLYKPLKALSKGYRRRVLLSLALLSRQPLLMLDEPFDGFDLRLSLSVMDLLRECRAGRTMILSIHQLTEAEKICDRFLLLDQGRVLGIGTLDELRKQADLTSDATAMFAATISDSLPTAAMFCLAVTLGSWVLDFAASGQSGLLSTLGSLSLTGMLRQFENGLLSTAHVVSFLSLALLFFLLTAIWLHPGRRLFLKLGKSFACMVLLGMVELTCAECGPNPMRTC